MNESRILKNRLLPFLICLLIIFFPGCSPHTEPSVETMDMRLSTTEIKGRTYYYYHRLSETEQDAYSRIFRQIKSHPEKIEIPPLEKEALLKVFQAISYDNPELLCMGGSCQLVTQAGKSYFVPSYHCSVAECAAMTEKLLEKARQIQESVQGKTSYEKELFFHDYLVEHCVYHEDTGNWRSYTAAGALLDGKAVCEGYSRAFQLLLDLAGIENYLITGSARDQDARVDGHMWNLVTIDGEKYHVDVTWDDPVGREQLAPSHVYFNLTDQAIAVNHLTFDPEPPGCSAIKANYFVKNGLFFQKYQEDTRTKIVEAIEQTVARDVWSLEFCFASQEEYEKAVTDLFSGERIYRLLERANLSGKGQIQTNKVQYHCDDEMLILNLTLEKKGG